MKFSHLLVVELLGLGCKLYDHLMIVLFSIISLTILSFGLLSKLRKTVGFDSDIGDHLLISAD